VELELQKLNEKILASFSFFLTFLTVFAGFCLASTTVSAEETLQDNVDISVPASCNLNSSVDTAHTAIVNAGTSVSDIGTTNFTVFCNDASGFALYAIGYTNEDDGDNTLVGQTTSNIINTGQATSGNTSAWAMKMIKVTDGSYQPNNLTITNNFNNYKEVPSTYTKVAEYTTSTDATLGSKLQSTYRAFMSTFQDADTYNGKVKYTLVHPHNVNAEALRNAITVVFDANGSTFPNGQTTNTVKYSRVCAPGEYGYVANTPYATVGTSNLNSDGTPKPASPSYTNNENIHQTITVPNADKVKVVVDYGITADTMSVAVAKGIWDDSGDAPDTIYVIYQDERNIRGQQSFTFDGDTVTIGGGSWNTPESGYDYGFYAKVYAVYDTEQANTTGEELPSNDCSVVPISGTYMENDSTLYWLKDNGSELDDFIECNNGFIKYASSSNFSCEDNLIRSLDFYYGNYLGSTITLYSSSTDPIPNEYN